MGWGAGWEFPWDEQQDGGAEHRAQPCPPLGGEGALQALSLRVPPGSGGARALKLFQTRPGIILVCYFQTIFSCYFGALCNDGHYVILQPAIIPALALINAWQI